MTRGNVQHQARMSPSRQCALRHSGARLTGRTGHLNGQLGQVERQSQALHDGHPLVGQKFSGPPLSPSTDDDQPLAQNPLKTLREDRFGYPVKTQANAKKNAPV